VKTDEFYKLSNAMMYARVTVQIKM